MQVNSFFSALALKATGLAQELFVGSVADCVQLPGNWRRGAPWAQGGTRESEVEAVTGAEAGSP